MLIKCLIFWHHSRNSIKKVIHEQAHLFPRSELAGDSLYIWRWLFLCIYHTGQPMCESLDSFRWLGCFRVDGVEVTVGPGGAAPLTDRVFKHYRHSYSNIWGWPHSVHWTLLSSPGPLVHDMWGQNSPSPRRFHTTQFLENTKLPCRIRSSSHL